MPYKVEMTVKEATEWIRTHMPETVGKRMTGGERMTVKELKDNLAFYDDDAEVVFEVDCDIEPKNITETKYGCTVYLNSRLKPTFIGMVHSTCFIGLEVEDDG